MLYQTDKNATELKITHLNRQQQKSRLSLLAIINDKTDKKSLKELKEKLTKQAKKSLKGKKKNPKRIFVLDFDGDVKASDVNKLREEISALVGVAREGDEVVVRLESGGGMVHSYGLAASQLVRLKEAGFSLTVCVDKVAASGGYMMACVADKIIASPFAIIGSIGVVAQIPNFSKLLKKNDVDFEMFTAGDFKRTVTVFGENTDMAREKFQEELEQTHVLFKDFVGTYRPSLDIQAVATGEHWYGEDAIKKGLIDEIKASDSYLLEQMKDYQMFLLTTQEKPTLMEKLGFVQASQSLINMTIDKLPEYMSKIEKNHFS